MVMIDITIPDEAVEAAAKALAAVRMPNYTWNDLDRGMQKYLRSDARAALRAGLATWPRSRQDYDLSEWSLILPLPQEKTDG